MSDDAAKEGAAAWSVPAINGGDGKGYLTAARLEALQQEAYDEAFKKGLEEGKAAAAEDIKQRCEQLDALMQSLETPFAELDEALEQQVVKLAMAVARQLFRREMKTEPAHVIGVVREAIQLLPATSSSATVHLHPDDATLVRESLTLTDASPAWKVAEDPLVARGGCRVTTENSLVDATAEARLKAVIASIAGNERD